MAVAALILLSVIGIVGVAVYLQRGAIGANLATSYLKDRGVPARIVIERLDPKGFGGSAVLGDPADPDLSVSRIEVEFESIPLFKSGFVAPRIRSMRLVEPKMKARWDGKRLTFGSLQPLIDDFSGAPGAGPGPTVVVERGSGRLATPYGSLRFTGDGRLDAGRLTRLSARLLPANLRQGETRAEIDGATLQASTRGPQLLATAHLDIRRLSQPGADARRLRADISGQVPYPTGPRFDGDVRLEGTVAADTVAAGPQTVTAPRLNLSVAGVSAGRLNRLSLRGSGTGAITADRWTAPGASASGLDLAGRVIGLNLVRAETATRLALSIDLGGSARAVAAPGVTTGAARLNARLADIQGTLGPGQGSLTLVPDLVVDVARANAGATSARAAGFELASSRAALDWRAGTWSLGGPIRARARAGTLVQPVLAGDLTLRTVGLDLAGDAAFGSQGPRFDLKGSAASRGGALSPEAARAFAASLPLIGTDPVGGPAILGAFREARLDAPAFALRSDTRGLRVSLPRPLQLIGTNGARAVVEARARAPVAVSNDAGFNGGLTARLTGRSLPEIAADIPAYRAGIDRGGLTVAAETRLTAAFTGANLRDLKLEAPARVTRIGGVISAALADCARVAAAGFGQAATPLLTSIDTRACADNGPVLTLGPRGWAFRTLLQDFQADAPAGDVHIAGGRARIGLTGTGGAAPVGAAEIAAARVTDAALAKRFEPLALAGRLALARDVWTGPVQVSEAAHNRPLAVLAVTHTMETATGSADIAAPALTFAKDGLQPIELSPLAGALATDAVGTVAFNGRADWSPAGGVVTSGRLTTLGVDFKSQFGLVKKATADLTFTSLAPLVTAPDQAVGAEEVSWLVPLTKATGRIAIRADRIAIDRAQAEVSGGQAILDPLDLLYTPNSPMSGAVRLVQIDLGDLIERFNLADKVAIEARIDGTVPFSFSNGALRLDKGYVFATGPGRLSIKREALTGTVATTAPAPSDAPGAPPPAPVPAPPPAPVPAAATATATGGVQDIAYQALENLAFDKLEATLVSQPMGRLGILFKINGRNDPPGGGETRIGLFDLLRGKALDNFTLPKGTPVNLTLDTSLNFDELLAAYNQRGRSEPVQQVPPTK